MAAIDFDATLVPTDIVAAGSLASQQAYTAQNLSGVASLFVREASSAPSPRERAFKIEPGTVFTIRPTGAPIYVWTDDAAGCPVILNEAA